MVLIDGIKYSCHTCITGHRTTKCTHTDRPLVEIKRKGRPISQCPDCREMRKTKSIHGRCDCAARKQQVKAPARVLQNGIVDLVKARSPSPELEQGAAPKGLRVSQLLNPCNCLNGGKCRCSVSTSASSPPSSPAPADKVALPVKSCCSTKNTSTLLPIPAIAPTAPIAAYRSVAEPTPVAVASKPSSCCSSKNKSVNSPVVTPIITISPPSAGGCCSSKSTPSPSVKSTPSLSLSTLFLPQTHGTASCFCGDTCACVGCPTHDPAGTKRASLSTASAAVSCGCGSGEETMDGEGGAVAKPCCGGAVGQLGLAQQAGIMELERVRKGAGKEGERVRLPPLLWGGLGGAGEKNCEKESGARRGKLPSIPWGEEWGGAALSAEKIEVEKDKDNEKVQEEVDEEITSNTDSQTSNSANPLSRLNPNLSPKRGKNKRRSPPSPPPPLLRNTRSCTVAPLSSTTTAIDKHVNARIPIGPVPTVDQPLPPSPPLATDLDSLEKQPAPIQLDAGDKSFEDVDVAMSDESEGGGCGSACRCAEEVGLAQAIGDGVGVGVGVERGGGLAAFEPLSDDFLHLQQRLQAQASLVQQPFALDFSQLDPLAHLLPLPDLSNLGFGFEFLQQPPLQSFQQILPTSIASQAPLHPSPPANQPSIGSTSSGCCSSCSARPTPTPVAEDHSLDLDLNLLRAEDIESYDFGGGGGAAWPTSLGAKAFGAEQQQEGHGGGIDEWDEDARVRAELMAAGFC